MNEVADKKVTFVSELLSCFFVPLCLLLKKGKNNNRATIANRTGLYSSTRLTGGILVRIAQNGV